MLQEQARQAPLSPVIIYDTKGDDGFLDVAQDDEILMVVTELDQFDKALRLPSKKRPDYLIVRPHASSLRDPVLLDEYLLRQYEKAGPSYALIDEAYMFHNGGRCGDGLTALLTRGRSKKISTIVATQRPAWLSLFCLTEATRFYIYRVINKDDRKRLSQITPYNPDLLLDKHRFWYYKQGDNAGQEYLPLPLRGTDLGYTPAEVDDLSTIWL